MKKTGITDKKPLADKVVLIDGLTRSGKFFLGKVVSGLEKMEYFQNVPILEYIPFLYRLGCLTEDAAVALLKAMLDENAYNMRIGRNLNTRRLDASSIYNSYEVDNYLERAVSTFGEISSTADDIIKSFREEERYSLFVVHETMPNIGIFFKAYPNLKIIHLMRNPIDVIHSWYLRGWGRRHGNDPLSLTPTIDGITQPVPWFARGWEEDYEASSEIDRVIKSVAMLIRMNSQAYCGLTEDERSQILLVRYEDVVENTNKEIAAISSFLNTEPSEGIPIILARERCPRRIPPEQREQKKGNIRDIAGKEAFDLMMRLASEYEKGKNPYRDAK